jgi:hypothetical protein
MNTARYSASQLVVTLALLVACSGPHKAPEAEAVPNTSIATRSTPSDLDGVEITLERTKSYRWHPSYVVTIEGTGRVRYTGRAYVPTKGEKGDHVSQDAVRGLLRRFEAIKFWDLKPEYKEPVSDMSSTILTLRVGDRTKAVLNYWAGPYFLEADAEVPDAAIHQSLDAVAQAIDKVVDITRWIGTEKERDEVLKKDRERVGNSNRDQVECQICRPLRAGSNGPARGATNAEVRDLRGNRAENTRCRVSPREPRSRSERMGLARQEQPVASLHGEHERSDLARPVHQPGRARWGTRAA